MRDGEIARSVTRRLDEGDEEMEAKDALTCSRETLKLVLAIVGRNR